MYLLVDKMADMGLHLTQRCYYKTEYIGTIWETTLANKLKQI